MIPRKNFLRGLFFVIILSIVFSFPAQATSALPQVTGISTPQFRAIEQAVKEEMKSRKIPGLALVIVKGNRIIYQNGFGYANLQTKQPVTPDTLFELGSTSKAFTALGILRLQEQGLLRITEPVEKYLPWFYMNYYGKRVTITISQLLHQTSGIPFASIQNIPVSEADSALEDTVKKLVGKELTNLPGRRMLYATINYDILGLIIQQVSGQSFEKYMETNVLQPLGLTKVFLFRQEAQKHGTMATGYKAGFMRLLPYNAPRYRGNTPAGYYITNAGNMGEWLKIQLGTKETSFRSLIGQTHNPDVTVPPGQDGSFYGMGWYTTQVGGATFWHEGENPNFSSHIILKPDQKVAVAVLTNLGNIQVPNSQFICQKVMDLLLNGKPQVTRYNPNPGMDNIATIVIFVAIGLILYSLIMIGISLVEFSKKQRKFQRRGFRGLAEFLSALGLLAFFGYVFYLLPDIIDPGFGWEFVGVWGPQSIVVAPVCILGAIAIFFILYLFITFFPKTDEKPYFVLTILSIATGLGNAFIIFIINTALERSHSKFATALFIFLITGIIMYVFGNRLVRRKMITITTDIVFMKRVTLITKILKASYQKLETLEGGKIQAGLNNDTEVVSNFANLLVSGVTNLITLLCCFVYLGILNFYGLLISIFVIVLATSLYFLVSQSARKLWEQNRDTQNQFFRFIQDLTGGYKELALHDKKREAFTDDMQQICETYRDKRRAGEFKFIDAFVIGELLFTFVIAVVAFIFPVVFRTMSTNDLRTYILVFLYMTGPVHGVLNTIPGLIQFQISWKRINNLVQEIASIEMVELEQPESTLKNREGELSLQLKGVVFQYRNINAEEFTVGPIDTEFASGEITFLTGGNGSGKSTLAKIITGLYPPMQGEITINGAAVSPRSLGQLYSAVFSEYYLFEKLYGVDYDTQRATAEHYLKVLRLEDKVQINQGMFSTTKLSTGQKRRLALLVCYLEDRPIFLFDEWAADQDPEFKKFFYYELLPGLKKKGKCVIAITHDDRYFDIADRIIKMENGRVNKQEIRHSKMQEVLAEA